MSDTDTKVLADNPTVTTMLAAYLNAAMSSSVAAQLAYQTTYGRSWSPLGCGASINDSLTTTLATVR